MKQEKTSNKKKDKLREESIILGSRIIEIVGRKIEVRVIECCTSGVSRGLRPYSRFVDILK